jgi:hypothetical protein
MMFGCKREDVTTAGWTEFQNEIHNLYTSLNIFTAIRLYMQWTGHVVRMRYPRATVLQSPKFVSGLLKTNRPMFDNVEFYQYKLLLLR